MKRAGILRMRGILTGKEDAMDKEISEILVEYGTNERLDRIAQKDLGYMEISEELDRMLQKKETLSLKLGETEERISSLYGEMMACYTKIAYRQGMKDSGEILKKCGIMPCGRELQ